MKPLKLEEINKAVKGTIVFGDPGMMIIGVSTDSRSVNPGELFIPLIGDSLDAHIFIPQAIARGCSAILVSKESDASPLEAGLTGLGLGVIECGDTTKALQDLARYYLSTFDMKKVGITGSTGKTTTKDMVYHICSEKFKSARNMGNFNNHIGLPLTVLSFEEGTEVGILEMGMSEKGEISLLAELVRPDIGVITNVGTAHIENLGSREDIFKAKMEITEYFGKDNTLIVNRDNDLLADKVMKRDYHLVTVGENGRSDLVISTITDLGEKGITFTLEQRTGDAYESQEFKLGIPGRHNAYNGALAVAVGLSLGVTLEEAARGLAKMQHGDKRLSIKGKNGVKIIDDTYNASVDSMKAGIDVLETISGMRKIAVLGDMLEMGNQREEYHREVGNYIGGKSIDLLITVGEASRFIAAGAQEKMDKEKMNHFSDKEQLMAVIKGIVRPGDVVLVKGSRGMKMDEIVKKLMED